jgi:hypothetical protein
MKAYVLRNDGFEFLWSWEAGAQDAPPIGETPVPVAASVAEDPPEPSGPAESAVPDPTVFDPAVQHQGVETRLQGLEGRIQATLLALEGVVRAHGQEAARQERDAPEFQAMSGELSRRVETLERRADREEGQAAQVAAQVGRWEGHAAAAFAAVENTLREQSDRIGTVESQTAATTGRSQELVAKWEDLRKRADASEGAMVRAEEANQRFLELDNRIAAIEKAIAEQAAQPSSGQPRTLQRLGWLLGSVAVVAAAIFGYANRGLAEVILTPRTPVTQPPAYRATIPVPELTPAPTPAITAVPAPRGMAVAVEAKLDTWLEVEADGATVFTKMLPAGEAKNFPAKRQVKVRAGNLSGIAVSLNGKPLGPWGSGRRVGTLVITPEGISRQP